MSITSRINEMSSHIEQAYDELQGLGADLTNVDKNIENISMVLDDIYDSMPQVSGEGTSLTLDDTRVGKIKSTLKGNTSQTTYSGYNLCEFSSNQYSKVTVNNDGTIRINGTSVGFSINYNSITFESGTAYSCIYQLVSGSVNAPNGLGIMSAFGTSGYWPGSGVKETVTPSSNLTRQGMWVAEGAVFTNAVFKVLIYKGSDTKTWEPYVGSTPTNITPSPNPSYPQPVNVVSGDNEINVVGKNLFDKDNYITDSWSSAYNGWVLNLEPGTYTLSANVKLHMIKGSEHNSSGWGNTKFGSGNANANTFTFSISENFNQYLWMSYTNSGGNEVSITKNNVSSLDVQLEKGSTATTYEPFNGNTYNIDLPVENLLNSSLFTNGTTPGITLTKNNDGTITLNGTSTARADFTIIDLFTLKGDNKIASIFKKGGTTTGNVTFGIYDSNWANGKQCNITSSSDIGNVSLSSEITYTKCFIRIESGITLSNLTIALQIEKGSKTNSYTPYGTTPIELCKIGDYQDYFGKSDGRNLFDKDNLTIEIGTISATGTFDYSTERLRAYYIEVDENTTYTVSTSNSDLQIVPYFYNSNKTFLSFDNGWKNFPYTFTTPSNTKYIALLFKNSNNTPSVGMIGNLQLEKGSSVSDYQPYGTGEWYYKEAIKKIILKGTGNTELYGNGGTSNDFWEYFRTSFEGGDGTANRTLTNYFNQTDNSRVVIIGNGTLYLRFPKNMGIDVSTNVLMNSWLSTHNTGVKYVRATPTYTKITSSNYPTLYSQLEAIEKAMSKDGQTNISQVNNDLPFKITASALKEWSV